MAPVTNVLLPRISSGTAAACPSHEERAFGALCPAHGGCDAGPKGPIGTAKLNPVVPTESAQPGGRDTWFSCWHCYSLVTLFLFEPEFRFSQDEQLFFLTCLPALMALRLLCGKNCETQQSICDVCHDGRGWGHSGAASVPGAL